MSRKIDAWKRQSKYVFKDGTQSRSFGVSLNVAPRLPDHKIPMVPELLIEFLQEKALDTEGLLRIPGGFNEVSEILQNFDEGTQVDLTKYEHSSLTEVLKKYLSELPEPLVPRMIDQLVKSLFTPDVQRKPLDEILGEMKFAIDSLPGINNEMLRVLTRFLSLVIANSSKNKMTLSNVVMCVAPVLSFTPAILTYCIQHHDYFFRGKGDPTPFSPRSVVESPPITRVDSGSSPSFDAKGVQNKVLEPNSSAVGMLATNVSPQVAARQHKRISIKFELQEGVQISQIELPLDITSVNQAAADEKIVEEHKRTSKEYQDKIMQLQLDVGMWKTVAQRQGDQVEERERELEEAGRKYQKERSRCRELQDQIEKLKTKANYHKDRYYNLLEDTRREPRTSRASSFDRSEDIERQQSMDIISRISFEQLLASEKERNFKEQSRLRPSSDPTARMHSSMRDLRETASSNMSRVSSRGDIRSRSTPRRRPGE